MFPTFIFKSSSALCLVFIELAGSQRRKLFCFKEDYNGVPDLSDLPPARNFELPNMYIVEIAFLALKCLLKFKYPRYPNGRKMYIGTVPVFEISVKKTNGAKFKLF